MGRLIWANAPAESARLTATVFSCMLDAGDEKRSERGIEMSECVEMGGCKVGLLRWDNSGASRKACSERVRVRAGG